MPRTRTTLRQPMGNPSLPDTGAVIVNLGADFNPMAEPRGITYGSSTPAAMAVRRAEDQRMNNLTLPSAGLPSDAPVTMIDQTRVAAQVVPAGADDGDEEDAFAALQRSEKRAKERSETLARENQQLRTWGQQQATIAATAAQAVTESQLDTVTNALSAATSDKEQAENDFAAAWARGDGLAVAKAQSAIADAVNRINTLRAGEDELKQRAKERPQPAAAPASQNFDIEGYLASNQALLPAEREWLREHPEALASPANRQRMDVAFQDATARGIERGSDEYFDFFDERMGYAGGGARNGGDAVTPAHQQRHVTPSRQMRVAAPASGGTISRSGRNVALQPGQILLTPAQREAAKFSGVSELDYARGLARMVEEKAQGMYGNQPTK